VLEYGDYLDYDEDEALEVRARLRIPWLVSVLPNLENYETMFQEGFSDLAR
jgi:hypothetical protein